MTLSLRVEIPVATTAIPPFARERRVMIGHFEDSLVCDEVDAEDAPLVAKLVLTGTPYPLDVRKLGEQFLLQITDVDLNAQNFSFQPRKASNLFSDGSVHRMFREAFEAVGDLNSLEGKWDTLLEKPLTSLRRMRLRDIDEVLAKLQMDSWRDFLKSPVLIDGRLYRACDEPFIEVALENYQTYCRLSVDRDWCNHETYAVYSLREVDDVKPMARWLQRFFGGRKPRRDFKILCMVDDDAFSANFIYPRFRAWGADVSHRLSWKTSVAALKFAAGLTPAHQLALREIDRAVRTNDVWKSPISTDKILSAMDVLRHDPYFELDEHHHVASWADILIKELEAAPVEIPLELRAGRRG